MTPLRLRRESLRLQKFSVTNTVLSLPFSQQIQFTLIVIKSSKLKNYTARQNRKRVNYDQSLLDDRHHGFELSRSADRHRLTATSCIPHDSVYMPGARAGTPNISNICEAEVTLTPLISKICKPCFQSSSLQPWHFRGIFAFCF